MDGLTATPVNPAPTSAPVPASAPTITPAPAPAPAPSSGVKIADIFKRSNMIELGFGVLGAAALYFTIYYYRYSMTMSKSMSADFQNKLDDLEIKVGDLQSVLDKGKPSGGKEFF